MEYIHHLGETLDEGRIGGKGANLANLLSAGFHVPHGFSVVAQAYRLFLDTNQLVEPISHIVADLNPMDFADAADRATRIQSLIMDCGMSEEVEAQIRSAYGELTSQINEERGLDSSDPISVSVRSSATAEDLPGASFAGQHDTYLNVRDEDGVVDGVQKCWASLWSSHAMHYRHQRGFDHMQVLMSVVVQEMIPATISGVMFTANPITGDRSEILINSCWGLGEAIVSGLVTPDNIVVAKEGFGVKSMDVPAKPIMLTLASGHGIEEKSVPPDQVTPSSITDSQIDELARLGHAVEEHYGSPQDIEWCFHGDTLSLLQSRPITTL